VVKQATETLSPALRYQVMLEPHNRHYLFTLDTAQAVEGRRNIQSFDGLVIATQPVTSPITYAAVSHLHVRTLGPLSITGRKLDTQLPVNRNPRSLALAQQLRSRSANDRDYTRAALDYFRATGFEYSLTPPLLDYNSVDDLIFNTKLGFCGHFASAYVTLMRAAGVPARVVTGYMGGEWNSIGGYYTVRQSDAHAWAEVWLDDEGWVRIDPTAVVAPERLRRGLRDILPSSGSMTSRLLHSPAWAREMLQAWDAANSWWRERVVNFNLSAQLNLLNRFGLGNIDYRGLALLLLGGAVLWGLLLAYWLSHHGLRTEHDALGTLWLHFIALLRRRGLTIAVHDGPRAIAHRAAQRLPSAAAHINAFSEIYLRLRFGPDAPYRSADLRNLRGLLRQIARATTTRRRAQTAPAARE
jgi:transglutaminase-like putative cysteine protease